MFVKRICGNFAAMMGEKQYDNIIIGIDPGTNVMGYALLGVKGKKPELIVMGVLQLERMEDHYMRLRHIYERNKPFTGKGTKSWKSFVAQHPDRVKKT